MDSARELLRASATDADAVRRYLQSIEAEELDGLLDGIAPRAAKCKSKNKTFLVQDDWLPLVHLLLQCEATRLRAASRVIQLLRRGSPSELESMQLLTEVNLGYAHALDELEESQGRTQRAVRRHKLLDEICTMLDVVFSFLDEVVRHTRPGKVLPQLLGLVPYFLGMLGELGDDAQTRALLAKLLELPWSCQTVPSLLDVLVDDVGLMSSESWRRLQENVERLVTTSPEMAGETMNPLIRECVLVASVTSEHKWVGVARYLLRQLPVHLRQEAEFNLQMRFHQSPRIVSLVCESIRSSKVSEEGGLGMKDATSLFDGSECGSVELTLDWRDLFLLLHSLQASKPILHHRTSSSRIATEASVFTEIERLAWRIVQSDVQAFSGSTSLCDAGARAGSKTLEKHVLDQVELLLNFGGKQTHAREWKALLLMDIAFFWIEQSNALDGDDNVATQKATVALLLLQAIFETTQETRAELLSCVFERSQKPAQRKLAGETLSQLFISQAGKLFPHLNAIQDWLGMQFQRSFDSAREFFLIASRLATVYKDLYNFLMVFLRKLLSSGNRLHQQFAVDMWCSWLDQRLPFTEQQEEEIVSALKNSVAACQDIHAWSLGRLGQVFQLHSEKPTISLRKSSWEEFHRFLSQEVGKFIEPTSGITEYGSEDDDDSADEYDDQGPGLPRFRFRSLDDFYQQNSSLDGAAAIGLVFQKLISCLIAFEKAASQSKVSSEGLAIEGFSEKESDVKQWLADLASNWKYFFHWVCQDSDELLNQETQGRACEKSAWWKLVARVYIGCAICNIVIEMLMAQQSVEDSDERDVDDLVFRGDGSGISVWALMEVEFSLHRMIQKLATHYANEMESSLSKEYVGAASNGLHRVLQPGKLQILNAVKCSLQDPAASRVPRSERASEMSFNALLFALDSFCSVVGDEDLYGAYHPRDSVLSEAGSMLESLLCVYLNVRERVVSVEGNADDVERTTLGNGGEERGSGSKLQFSLYADAISAKFPTSARHLAAQGKHAKDVVLLDGKGGEEILEHVCAAIGRTVEMMIKNADLCSVHDRLGHVLRSISWTRHQLPDAERSSDMNNFVRLSRYFLHDVNVCVQLDGLTKLGVSCASLSKRLRDMATEMTDSSVPCSDLLALSSLAYDVLCDNVVYNPRLLRLLTSICLPIQLARQTTTFVTLESKIEGIIQSCGLNPTLDATAATSMREEPSLVPKAAKRSNGTPNRRKRLRKGFDARSSYGLRVDSDSDSNASHSSDYDDIPARSDDSCAGSNSISVREILSQPSSPNRDRIPHLQSLASQSIALLAVLSVLEQSQSTLLSTMTAKNGATEPYTFPHHQEILGYIRIHDLVNRAMCSNRDFSWGTRKVLLKVLHMIELGLRIGKSSGAPRKGGITRDSAVCVFESSVSSALRSRTWVDGVKDASQDSGTKAKVSATLLKMDVFFLQVPGTVQSWLKEAPLCDATTERLKSLVSSVKERIAPTDQGNGRRGKPKARQRLLGVVPIVRKRRKRLRSRHPIIDAFLNEEDGADAFADLEDFIE